MFSSKRKHRGERSSGNNSGWSENMSGTVCGQSAVYEVQQERSTIRRKVAEFATEADALTNPAGVNGRLAGPFRGVGSQAEQQSLAAK